MATVIRSPLTGPTVYKPRGGGATSLNPLAAPSQGFGDRSLYPVPPIPQLPVPPPSPPPVAFDRTPLLEKIRGVSRDLPAYTPIAPGFMGQAPVPIARPTPEFFKNLFEAKAKPIEKQFFAPGGVSEQAITNEAQRGFLMGGPSGVAGQLYQQTVTDPYVSALADVQNQVNIIQAETELQLSQFDAQRQDEFRRFSADLQSRDQEAGFNREISQRNIDSTFLTLESNIMNAQSEEELQRYATEVGLYENMVNQNRLSSEFDREFGFKGYETGLREEESLRNAFVALGGDLAAAMANPEMRRLFGIPEDYALPGDAISGEGKRNPELPADTLPPGVAFIDAQGNPVTFDELESRPAGNRGIGLPNPNPKGGIAGLFLRR